ncbi:MAG TPA: hypothetical protein DEB36_10695 [Porphyromonadaceae bacterium]|nr:Hypothetical protein (Precursor) [Petrimonas sp. IBARAKI]HBF96148.1 hypothetical protein [Porphyromonadaceae bacterium]HBU46215.1 hypothetical protein [Porphyromonadaceae bacterium]
MNTVNKQIISQAIPVTILVLTVYSVLSFAKRWRSITSVLNNTTIVWVLSIIILAVFFLARYSFFDRKNEQNLRIVWIYLLWNIVCIVRGMLVAEIYWDWKGLISNAMALLLPIVAYSATNKKVVQYMLSYYVRYVLPLFLIFALILRADAYGFYLIPMSFLLLFLPALTLRQKILVITVTLVVITADLGARSNVIKFGVPLLILGFYYLRSMITVKVMEAVRLSLFVIPVVLFLLGVSEIFNVFKMDDYVKGDYTTVGTDEFGNRVEINVTTDTRTFIYSEVLQSAINNNYWLLGRTPARGNDSEIFGERAYELTRRSERLANEIGLANVFTWTGIAGVILYTLIFFRASYLAVNRSANIYAKMLGIYIAFRWLYAWVEDVNNFSLNYFMLWVMIGLCFSYTFREMTNKEVAVWVRGIFDVRYIRLQNHLIKKEKQWEKK